MKIHHEGYDVAAAPKPGESWRIATSRCLSRFDRCLVGRLCLIVELHTCTSTMVAFHTTSYDVYVPGIGPRTLCSTCLERAPLRERNG